MDNPKAFPTHDGDAGTDPRNRILQGGMTLRDWFAGQALAGIMARLEPSGFQIGVNEDDWSCPAGDAYRVANAMLSARKEN